MTAAEAKTRNAVVLATALTVLSWIVYSWNWSVWLDGDAALYPIMSAEILKGHHFLYTAGQAHGGTLLTYLRALVFAVLGLNHFAASLMNGLTVVVATALWSSFAGRLGGWVAALVTGAAIALASDVFVQYSFTDYYASALVCGGLMLHGAAALAKRDRVSGRTAFLAGLLIGFSLYICRFTALYALAAGAFFQHLSPPARRAALVPAARELIRPSLSKLFAAAIGVNLFFFIAAFFTSDRFLGLNAEISLKITVGLTVVLWLLHRWRLLVGNLSISVLFVLGALVGLAPHIAFGLTHPGAIDRTTGLVRWSDLSAALADLPLNVAMNFSRTAPWTFGVAGALGAAALLILGLATGGGRDRRGLVVALVVGFMPAVGSWLLIHTYMYFKPQYLYPAVLPLALCLGLAAAMARPRALALALALPVLAAGAQDVVWTASQPNRLATSGVLEQMKAWDVGLGSGEYDATYNLMWTYKDAITLDPFNVSRFPLFHDRVAAAPKLVYIYRPGDSRPDDLVAGRMFVKAHAELKNGYSAELLVRK